MNQPDYKLIEIRCSDSRCNRTITLPRYTGDSNADAAARYGWLKTDERHGRALYLCPGHAHPSN